MNRADLLEPTQLLARPVLAHRPGLWPERSIRLRPQRPGRLRLVGRLDERIAGLLLEGLVHPVADALPTMRIEHHRLRNFHRLGLVVQVDQGIGDGLTGVALLRDRDDPSVRVHPKIREPTAAPLEIVNEWILLEVDL